MKKKIILIFVLLVIFNLSLFSITTVEKKFNSLSDYIKGHFKGISISEDGKLSLSYEIKDLVKPSENLVFSAATDQKGVIYLGTGHSGKLYKIQDGKIKEVYKTGEPDIFALTVDNGGNLYFASSPNGKIYKMDKKGKVKEFFNSEDRFYWQLAVKRGKLYVAAGGNRGKLYIIDLKTALLLKTYEIDELNVFKLFLKGNKIYIGGSNKGTVYEIKGENKESIFQSDKREIKGIFVNDKDEIFVALGGSSLSKESTKNRIIIRKTVSFGKIVKINKDGETEIIWKSKNEMPYDLTGAENKILWVTGNKGRVYSYNKGKVSLIGELKGEIGVSLTRCGDKFIGLYNFPAGVFEIDNKLIEKGIYTSDIIDTGTLSTYGNFYLKSKGDVFASYRGGNTEEPDNSWTEWSPYMKDSFKITLNKKRFFQIRIKMEKKVNIPFLEEIRFFYLPVNRKPIIERLIVDGLQKISRKSLFFGKTSSVKNNNKKIITINYRVVDSDKDKLVFTLFIKRRGEKKWDIIKKDFYDNRFILDSTNYEEGSYIVKLLASDLPSNPKNIAKSSYKISNPFIIDYTSPEIKFSQVTGNTIKFKVVDNLSFISKVSYHTGDRKWKILFPDDKLFDSKEESFTIDKKTSKIYIIKAEDKRGNTRVRIYR
jgi:hypothetical protein